MATSIDLRYGTIKVKSDKNLWNHGGQKKGLGRSGSISECAVLRNLLELTRRFGGNGPAGDRIFPNTLKKKKITCGVHSLRRQRRMELR